MMKNAAIDIGLPEKMQIFDHGTYIEIVRKWLGPKFYFLTVFVIFWNGFLLFWYSRLTPDAELMEFLFPLIHVGVGVGLTYYVLTGWFNRTHIFAGQGKVGVRHRPLPWLGNKILEAHDLKQLYAKEKISRYHGSDGSSTTATYEVRAVTNSGRNIKIVGGLATQEQAIFIEQQIEKYLNIEDVPVPGEIYKHRA